ncbi:MAG TPA: hypothetical protein VK484_15055 [Ferruginibacter sp.]|nr:hypothetical protein [Ferruginibacter sp.]
MKIFLLIILIAASGLARAQKVESIHVNLYTDSLKKGTFNYINIDGLLSTGRYLPLDSSDLIFTASAGKFSGNNLWIDRDIKTEKVNIKVVLRKDPSIFKEFVIYIKQKPDPELRSLDQLMNEPKSNSRSKRNLTR